MNRAYLIAAALYVVAACMHAASSLPIVERKDHGALRLR